MRVSLQRRVGAVEGCGSARPCLPLCRLPVTCHSVSGGAGASAAPDASQLRRRAVLLAPVILQSIATLISPAAGWADEGEPAAAAIASPEAAPAVSAPAAAVSSVPTAELADDQLAYSFRYPVATTSGRPLKMLLARAPEKYSSAAPLTADARQRIVSELFDYNSVVTISVTVGPASGVLKGVSPDLWKAQEVALTVLIDRSTSRMSTGQRFALNEVESARREVRGGNTFFVYEHRTQGSPTENLPTTKETFRHALAVTGYRNGLSGEPYLYTLNLSCQEERWADLAAPFLAAVESFQLNELTDAYIPPDKDPWRFF